MNVQKWNVDWENCTGLESRPLFNPSFDTRAAAEGKMHGKASDKNVKLRLWFY